jgi:hypothetical protein
MRIVAINHLTLDGVTQAPAGADEDLRGASRTADGRRLTAMP